MTDVLCECPGFCSLRVPVTAAMYGRCLAERLFVIGDGCRHGPGPDDELVERGSGYGLYRDRGLHPVPAGQEGETR